jgi:hypothetical protein
LLSLLKKKYQKSQKGAQIKLEATFHASKPPFVFPPHPDAVHLHFAAFSVTDPNF